MLTYPIKISGRFLELGRSKHLLALPEDPSAVLDSAPHFRGCVCWLRAGLQLKHGWVYNKQPYNESLQSAYTTSNNSLVCTFKNTTKIKRSNLFQIQKKTLLSWWSKIIYSIVLQFALILLLIMLLWVCLCQVLSTNVLAWTMTTMVNKWNIIW